MFPIEVQPVIDELLPLCRALGEGKYAVSIGGSYGKGTFDRQSDLDFRLFCERREPDPDARKAARQALKEAIDRWATKGFIIDGCWTRTIDEIETQLELWTRGEGVAPDIVWTIWGYHIVTDVYNQAVIEDPYGILAEWRERLSIYPAKMKETIIKRHTASLDYWRQDYHYANKVVRRDLVFLAGLTTKLVHDLIQVLFALNETYYPGDGKNLHFTDSFAIVPPQFRERVRAILYPGRGEEAVTSQRIQLMALIDEVVILVPQELR
jgi:uncharacterized protein DUF4037/nucleotidyltransferase-like protein